MKVNKYDQSLHSLYQGEEALIEKSASSRFSWIKEVARDGELAFLVVTVLVVATQILNMIGGNVAHYGSYLTIASGGIYSLHSLRNLVSKIQMLKKAGKAVDKKEILRWAIATIAYLGITFGYFMRPLTGSLDLAGAPLSDASFFSLGVPAISAISGGLGMISASFDLHRVIRERKKLATMPDQTLEDIYHNKDRTQALKRELFRQEHFLGNISYEETSKWYDTYCGLYDLNEIDQQRLEKIKRRKLSLLEKESRILRNTIIMRIVSIAAFFLSGVLGLSLGHGKLPDLIAALGTFAGMMGIASVAGQKYYRRVFRIRSQKQSLRIQKLWKKKNEVIFENLFYEDGCNPPKAA